MATKTEAARCVASNKGDGLRCKAKAVRGDYCPRHAHLDPSRTANGSEPEAEVEEHPGDPRFRELRDFLDEKFPNARPAEMVDQIQRSIRGLPLHTIEADTPIPMHAVQPISTFNWLRAVVESLYGGEAMLEKPHGANGR